MPNGNLRIGGQSKSWCGIFAVAVWAWAGIGVKWTLNWTKEKGNMLRDPGLGWKKVSTNRGIRPGDIAYINARQHHYIVTDVGSTHVCSVDGNQEGNTIKEYRNWKRDIASIVCYYTISD